MRPGLVFYIVLTFAISWGGLLTIGGLDGISADTWQTDPMLPVMVAAMLAGPSVAAIVMTLLVYGRAGARELLSRIRRWRVAARWYAVALLLAPVVFIVVHLSLALASPLFLPSIITVSNNASLVLSSIGCALAVGFYEELGWTGFATRHLRSRHSAPATALMVGVTWGAWHLLTNDFWIANKYSGDLPEPLFVTATALALLIGQLPVYRVLMVWVYDRTGSLLVVMLMHARLVGVHFHPRSHEGDGVRPRGLRFLARHRLVDHRCYRRRRDPRSRGAAFLNTATGCVRHAGAECYALPWCIGSRND